MAWIRWGVRVPGDSYMLQRTKGVPEALIPDYAPLGIKRQAAEGEGEAGVPMLADCLLLALPGLYLQPRVSRWQRVWGRKQDGDVLYSYLWSLDVWAVCDREVLEASRRNALEVKLQGASSRV